MDGQNTKVISGETPNSEGTAQWSDARVSALKHAVCRYGILLLTSSLLLHVGDASSNILLVDSVAAALAELELILELLSLVLKPLRDLLPTERELP